MKIRLACFTVCCSLAITTAGSWSQTRDEFQGAGDIKTTEGCSTIDTTRSDGQSGLFFLAHRIDSPRDKGFEDAGVGTIQEVGTGAGVTMDKNVGVMYVIGSIREADQKTIVIQWKGCSGSEQMKQIQLSVTSKICAVQADVGPDKLKPGDIVTAKINTMNTPNTLIKAVIGERSIKFRPFFQSHFILLGQDFWQGNATTCRY